jgi:spectinomycin phosphotransferase
MREPPSNLADDALLDALRRAYRQAVTRITFLPLGHDSSAWVYRADAEDGTPYFLKVRTRVDNRPALAVPFALHEQGVTQVVAPLPAAGGELWASAGDYAIILYPFVEGRTGMEQGMSDAQWRAYGAVMRQVHAAAVPAELAAGMRREDFSPGWAPSLRAVDAAVAAGSLEGEERRDTAQFWTERRDTIHHLLERAESLGRRLAASALPLVLCHADVHTNNVLLEPDGRAWLVDWDETMLAPKERDLMFVLGGGISRALVSERDEALFLEGYGEAAADRLALAYYRYAWAVNDIGAYGAEVFLRPDLGPVTRRAALQSLRTLFAPGEIVSLALDAEIPA